MTQILKCELFVNNCKVNSHFFRIKTILFFSIRPTRSLYLQNLNVIAIMSNIIYQYKSYFIINVKKYLNSNVKYFLARANLILEWKISFNDLKS